MTTRVRFLDPVDPRVVWRHAAQLVEAPADYRYKNRSQRDGDVLTIADTDQGAGALLLMYSGKDGGPLADDGNSPRGFVELCFDQPYSCCNPDQQDAWATALAIALAARTVTFRGERTGPSWVDGPGVFV